MEEKKLKEKRGKTTTFVEIEKSNVLERTLSAGVGPVLSRIRTVLSTGGEDDVKISLRDLNVSLSHNENNPYGVVYSTDLVILAASGSSRDRPSSKAKRPSCPLLRSPLCFPIFNLFHCLTNICSPTI